MPYRITFEPRTRGPLYLIQTWGLPAMVLVLLLSLWGAWPRWRRKSAADRAA